jgi:alpha/beta superfamily hydrolase
MVTKGQLLERPVIIPAGDICLDGIYLRGGEIALMIASPLPSSGGNMANPVLNELAYAAAYAGRASLRLDYQGMGASEGEPSHELAGQVRDLRMGIDFLLESAGGEGIALAGYDSGCWAALATAKVDERVDRLLLVCPSDEIPPGTPDFSEVVKPTLVVLPDHDPSTNRGEWELRKDAVRHLRLHTVPAHTRTLREGLTELARLVPFLLGAPPKE